MDSGLGRDIVVLNTIEQLRQAPERIGLDSRQNISWQLSCVEQLRVTVYTE